MKLNKLFFILLSVSVLVSFSSCGSDDDNFSESDLFGTWGTTKVKASISTNNSRATKLINAFLSEFESEGQLFTFYEDGIYEEKDLSEYPYPYSSGTYRVKGNKLYLKEDGQPEEDMYVVSVSKNNLTMTANYDPGIDLVEYLWEELSAEEFNLVEDLFQDAGIDIYSVRLTNVNVVASLVKTSAI